MKSNYIQFVATFLICLILSLPFYSSSVNASFSSVSVKGSSGIEGIAKVNDNLNFVVLATSSGNSTINKDQVKLGTENTFDSCSKSGDTTECKLKYPSSGTETFEAKATPFTINLYSSGQIEDSISGVVLIDAKPPQVSMSLSANTFSLGEKITVSFDAKDLACDDAECQNSCAGLKNIEIYTIDNKINENIDAQSSGCSLQSNIEFDSSILNPGLNSIFAKATDKFNQVSIPISSTFTITGDSTEPPDNETPDEEEPEDNTTNPPRTDNVAPKLLYINITAVGGSTEAFAGIIKIGDKFGIVAQLTENEDLSASADFSRFITDAKSVSGECQKISESDHLCTWLTDEIGKSGFGSITFNFTDSQQNSLIVKRSVKVLGLNEQTQPDFWKSEVSCSPPTIDRQLGPLINQRVFCSISLTSKSPAVPVFISPATCSDDKGLIQSFETKNNEKGSKKPIIVITLKKGEYNIDEDEVTCSFSIFSQTGSTITKNPETEDVLVDLKFYNLPLGELSDEVERKIKDAKEDAEGIWEIITTINKIIFYAKKICQLFGMLYNIISVLYGAGIALGIFNDNACTNLYLAYVCPAAFSAKMGACGTQQTARETTQTAWQNYGSKFCKFVNCQWTGIGFIDQYKQTLAGYINKVTPGSQYLPEGYTTQETKTTTNGNTVVVTSQTTVRDELQSGVVRYINPQTNLIAATLFVCLPGIVYSLDKYRQIKCLYADCLQNAVAKDGIPVTACENQKAYATCKYITGEIFAFFPFTAVFDHYMDLIKGALSNPFVLLGVGISAMCYFTCKTPAPTSTAVYVTCEGFKLLSTMGSVIGEIQSMIKDGFQIREDYCARLEESDKDNED